MGRSGGQAEGPVIMHALTNTSWTCTSISAGPTQKDIAWESQKTQPSLHQSSDLSTSCCTPPATSHPKRVEILQAAFQPFAMPQFVTNSPEKDVPSITCECSPSYALFHNKVECSQTKVHTKPYRVAECSRQ